MTRHRSISNLESLEFLLVDILQQQEVILKSQEVQGRAVVDPVCFYSDLAHKSLDRSGTPIIVTGSHLVLFRHRYQVVAPPTLWLDHRIFLDQLFANGPRLLQSLTLR